MHTDISYNVTSIIITIFIFRLVMLFQKRDVFFTNSSILKYISLLLFFLLRMLITHSNESIPKHFFRIVVSILRAHAMALK
jgi:hypothetical protein